MSDIEPEDHNHQWHFAGETGNDEVGRYTKWACPCGAFKIKSLVLVEDDTGSFI